MGDGPKSLGIVLVSCMHPPTGACEGISKTQQKLLITQNQPPTAGYGPTLFFSGMHSDLHSPSLGDDVGPPKYIIDWCQPSHAG